MGEAILIYGKSGSGKSRSLCNFGEDEIIEALQDIVNYLSDTAYDLEEFHDDFSALVQKLVELP